MKRCGIYHIFCLSNEAVRKMLSDIKKDRLKNPIEVNKILKNLGPNGPSFIGSMNPRAKITEAQASEIINRLKSGEHPNSIKKDYLIGVNMIYAIKSKKAWTHLQQ